MENYKKSTGDFLLEFFSEEVPARMQFQSGVHLEESFKKAFDKRDIRYGKIEIFTCFTSCSLTYTIGIRIIFNFARIYIL